MVRRLQDSEDMTARALQAGMTINNVVRQALGLPLASTTRGTRRRRHD